MNKLTPLGTQVIVRPDAAVKQTDSGILLSEAKTEASVAGEVLAVGRDVTEVKVGDRVHYGVYTGQKTKFDDLDLTVLKEDDIFAVEE